ncbi:MAG: BspA family leucine-rich repeat surface protein [Treponema sp.]|nr:BspA family leucine-rich repeat surface protein [Treponema sp.]
MKKITHLVVLAMAIVLTMGFVSCNNDPEPKEKPVKGYALKPGLEINDIFWNAEKLNAKEATAFAKATAAPTDVSFYLDIAEKDVPVWYDEANTSIYYYIESGKKLILNEDSSKMFAGLSYNEPAKFESIDTSDFYTGNVTNMESMFYSCKTLKNLDLRSFDTSNVQNMRGMFETCSALETLDVSSFDTRNVQDMSFMFSGLSKIKQIDVSHFNTSNAVDMQYMFQSCRQLGSLDVSHFNTNNVTKINAMFKGCNNVKTLDVSHFNTSNVTDMWQLFNGCLALESIDLSSFDIKNLTSTKNMFRECHNLVTIYVSKNADWASSTVITDSTDMFKDCPKLKGGAGTEYDAEKTDKSYARVDGGADSPGFFTAKK